MEHKEKLKLLKEQQQKVPERKQLPPQKPAKKEYDPTDNWDNLDEESEEYSSSDNGQSDRHQKPSKKRHIERGFGGQLYEYRGSSADEDESEVIEEASFGEIEEEEYRTLKIGEQEDEEELQRQRNIKRYKKWQKRCKEESCELSDVSFDDDSLDDY